jgi:hypothetical protein
MSALASRATEEGNYSNNSVQKIGQLERWVLLSPDGVTVE